jgi:hypothetical protein
VHQWQKSLLAVSSSRIVDRFFEEGKFRSRKASWSGLSQAVSMGLLMAISRRKIRCDFLDEFVVTVVGRVPVADGRARVPRIVVPGTPAGHTNDQQDLKPHRGDRVQPGAVSAPGFGPQSLMLSPIGAAGCGNGKFTCKHRYQSDRRRAFPRSVAPMGLLRRFWKRIQGRKPPLALFGRHAVAKRDR